MMVKWQSLHQLLAALPWPVEPVAEVMINGVTDDSRAVQPGSLFVAVPGVNVDGHRYISSALQAGAVAVVGEQAAMTLSLPPSVPYIRVPDARIALGWLHAAWHEFPARQLTLIGVTGTDGKTTTTNLVYQMLLAEGLTAGMISTVNARIGGQRYDTGLHTTTPPADEVQRYLAQMVAAGTTHAVLEVTSHGLAQQRLAGCDFDVAVITNVTHEHLDYHGSLEAYLEAKAQLFRGLDAAYEKPDQPKIAVLNRDDPLSYAVLSTLPLDSLTYALDSDEADVTARHVRYTSQGLSFELHIPGESVEITSPLVGAYNVSNILAAATAALAAGVSMESVAQGVANMRGVPGRMELIDEGQPFTAIVDFAHTPNALRRALETARQMAAPEGRVIVVFGSAGLRDQRKRRMMGEVAGSLADLTVVTAEDPRTEPLADIMATIAAGLASQGRREGQDFWLVPDRGRAILRAVELARPGDVVLTCGKGHEQSMCFGEIEYPWDDRTALRRALHGETLDSLPTHAA